MEPAVSSLLMRSSVQPRAWIAGSISFERVPASLRAMGPLHHGVIQEGAGLQYNTQIRLSGEWELFVLATSDAYAGALNTLAHGTLP